jgi:hypothetical protein
VIRDIALGHGDAPVLAAQLRLYQLRALTAIATCGTPAAGLHAEVCDQCGDRRMQPNTCANRCCPHCQGRERAAWVAARTAELLPCGYFHAVLTLPSELRALAQAFPAVVLGCLLRAASDAIDHLCRKPDLLGAEVGQLAVLHTWKRDLGWHPHVHLIVTAGGWDAHRQCWVEARRQGPAATPFLVPAAVLSRAFQLRLRRLLLTAYARGEFQDGPHEAFPALATMATWTGALTAACARPWVVRIEPPFGGPQQLLKYLGAYVNRVAISPGRITAYDPVAGLVTYTWSTNAEPGIVRTATLPAVDFLQRFAQHILPPRFHRIRFRGLWSTAHRAAKLHVAQQWFATRTTVPPAPPAPPAPPPEPPTVDDPCICTTCGLGRWRIVPGSWQRPPAAERRRLLAEARTLRRTQAPVEAAIPA